MTAERLPRETGQGRTELTVASWDAAGSDGTTGADGSGLGGDGSAGDSATGRDGSADDGATAMDGSAGDGATATDGSGLGGDGATGDAGITDGSAVDGAGKPDGSASGPPGTLLTAGTDLTISHGVTSDGYVAYTYPANARVGAVSMAGGAPQVVTASAGANFDIYVIGKAIGVWTNVRFERRRRADDLDARRRRSCACERVAGGSGERRRHGRLRGLRHQRQRDRGDVRPRGFADRRDRGHDAPSRNHGAAQPGLCRRGATRHSQLRFYGIRRRFWHAAHLVRHRDVGSHRPDEPRPRMGRLRKRGQRRNRSPLPRFVEQSHRLSDVGGRSDVHRTELHRHRRRFRHDYAGRPRT